MLSMGHFARDILDRLHHSASYFPEEFADRLIADIQEIAKIDWTHSKDLFIQRKTELLLTYGLQPTPTGLEKPFAFADGMAIIPVHGMLLNRFSGSYGFATGYNFIRSQRMAAEADPDVKAIVYDYNTYGGTAAGCPELSLEMFNSRAVKPSLGIIDASCYSAGYFLGSANDRLVATPSSGIGSIGCVSMHVDMSAMLEKEGVKITFFKSGKEKTDGNPFEPLSSTAKKTIQQSVDYHASMFFDAVLRNRGIDEGDIRAMEARCFDPPDALENGLIDAVQTPADAISNLSVSGENGPTFGVRMANSVKFAVGASRSLPINTSQSWDGPAAAGRMLDAAGIGGNSPKPDQAKTGFLVWDSANPNLRGSYHLPFADIISGTKTALQSGWNAAASRLPQMNNLPQSVRDDARAVIDSYQARAKKGTSSEGIEMTPEELAAAIQNGISAALPIALAAHDTAKRERRAAVMALPEAEKRQKLAAHLADNTAMSAEDIKGVLANSAEELPQQSGNGRGRTPFHQAMDRTPNPRVGADNPGNGGEDGDGGDGGESDTDVADRLLSTYAAATGNKVVPVKKAA
jgi:signal peptide peptidase SppA